MQTLAIAGVDGTIKRRFQGSVVSRHAWMKTGTLKHVKNIVGYVEDKAGNYYTVVILVNTNKGNWKSAQLQNDIIRWLVSRKKQSTHKVSPQKLSAMQYWIQVGSFEHAPTQAYLKSIWQQGFPTTTRHSGSLYKVLVGAYESEKKVKRVLEKVKASLSKKAFIIKE